MSVSTFIYPASLTTVAAVPGSVVITHSMFNLSPELAPFAFIGGMVAAANLKRTREGKAMQGFDLYIYMLTVLTLSSVSGVLLAEGGVTLLVIVINAIFKTTLDVPDDALVVGVFAFGIAAYGQKLLDKGGRILEKSGENTSKGDNHG